jgi:hypothetical protein
MDYCGFEEGSTWYSLGCYTDNAGETLYDVIMHHQDDSTPFGLGDQFGDQLYPEDFNAYLLGHSQPSKYQFGKWLKAYADCVTRTPVPEPIMNGRSLMRGFDPFAYWEYKFHINGVVPITKGATNTPRPNSKTNKVIAYF